MGQRDMLNATSPLSIIRKGKFNDLPGNVAIVSLFVFSPGRIVTTKALMAKTHIRSLKCVKLTNRIEKKLINKSINKSIDQYQSILRQSH